MNILHDKWPRRRRAAEQRDERASLHHSITSSARASKVGGENVMTRGVSVDFALRPARTTHRAIWDDRHHTNLVRTASLLRADMIFGKDRCG